MADSKISFIPSIIKQSVNYWYLFFENITINYNFILLGIQTYLYK